MSPKKHPDKPLPRVARPVTEFKVEHGGTLRMANFAELTTRADFYESVADSWSGSQVDLVDAMEECQPLAWAVHSIYDRFRSELVADLEAAQRAGRGYKRRLAKLKARLKPLPDEPEEGAADWLLGLTTREFESQVVTEIDGWFGEPPDWTFEDDYLPECSTAQGAALEYFRDMTRDELKTLGVEVVEGEHPGSTYYAAELRKGIDEANRAAELGDIPVRFVATAD